MFIKKIVATCFLTIASLNVFSESMSGVATDWAPFTNSKHENGGIIIELVREALAVEGVDLENKFLPWKRVQAEAQKGNFGMILGVWYTDERAKNYNFSDPVLANRVSFVKRKGDSFNFTDISSLDGKKVGTIRGYSYPEKFAEATNFDRQEGGDILSNVKKLVAGRIDITMDDEIVIKTILASKAPDLLDKIEFVEKPLSSEKVYIVSSHKNADNANIIETFNKGLAKIKSNGKYKEIMESYGIKN